jgi:hypothetical protein
MRLRRSASWAAATLVLVAAHPLPARGTEPLVLRAEPSALVLAAGARATIEIEAGVEELPIVTANVGRVVNLRAVGGGRFTGEFLPPSTAHPQVAIVAASSAGRWGWTAIPLWGRGLAVARSAPHANIRVTIGDTSFGPVRADAAGEARVPVVVPSGVERAYHRDKPLDLGVPPTLHVHLAVAREAAPADVAQEVPVRVFAVTPSGSPRGGAPVVVEVTHGEIVALTEVAPGELAGTWRLPAGAAEPATARVRLADEASLAFASSLERPPGAPAHVTLEADRAAIVAGEGLPVTLRVHVADAAGNPAYAAPHVEATLGAVSTLHAISPGAWEARLDVPAAVRRARRIDVTARAGGLVGQTAIAVAPAPVPPGAGERRTSAGPKLGIAMSRGGLRASYLGAEAAYRPALLDGRLTLALELGTFVRDRADEVRVGDQLLSVYGRARYAPMIASARLQHALGPRQDVWAGAGAGAAHVASEVSVGSGPATSESGVVPVLHASAGWSLRAGRARPFAEGRVSWHGASGFVALRGSLATLTFLLGCRYDAL